MADKASRRVTDENDGCSAATPRRPRPWVDTVGNTTSGQSDRMSAIEAVTAGIGGDDALNADLLGTTDMLVTATGNFNVCTSAMLRALKSGAVVCLSLIHI